LLSPINLIPIDFKAGTVYTVELVTVEIMEDVNVVLKSLVVTVVEVVIDSVTLVLVEVVIY
jgi:hypothetical protein